MNNCFIKVYSRCAVFLLAVFLQSNPDPVLGQFEYRLDDGSFEASQGLSPTAAWGMMFEVNPNATTITQLQFSFHRDPSGEIVGQPMNWAIYGDNDDDPRNGLTLLQNGVHTIENAGLSNGVFDEIPTRVDVSNFAWLFVASEYTVIDGVSSNFASSRDVTTPRDRGWHTTGFSGWNQAFAEEDNYAIRAVSGDGYLLGDINHDSRVDLLDVAPFVDALVSGDYLVEADINEDGSFDLFDVQPFVERLNIKEMVPFVIPQQFSSKEAAANDGDALGPQATTSQVVYGEELVLASGIEPGTRLIGISFRLNGSAFFLLPGFFDDYHIGLSTSVNPPGDLVADKLANRGSDYVLARSGKYSLNGDEYPSGNQPNEFGEPIVFSKPFVYQGGDLLLEYTHTGYSAFPTPL